MEKNEYFISDLQEDLKKGKKTCIEHVQEAIDAIKKEDQFNAFLEVFEESAIQDAKKIDIKISSGTQGRLAGVIVGIKDNICYQGHKVSASSKILEGFESLFSATVVEKLQAEDAIIIGRLNCDEFAMGSSNENSAFGPVKNPLDVTKVPGGSSGGVTAAVSAGLCMVGLGSDTGGSIRQPASFCGLYGMKPTYGRVSRHGLIAYASSFDQISPVARSLEDLALVTEIISGKDDFDSTAVNVPHENIGDIKSWSGKKKIGVFKSYIEHEGLDQEIKDYVEYTLRKLEAEGFEICYYDFDYLDHMIPAYYVLTTAEASSNLARYDGIHFGYRSQKAVDLATTYEDSRTEGFGPEVKRRIMLGTYVLSAGYYDAYYSKAQKVRRKIQDRVNEILEEVSFLLLPTTPHTAFELGSQADDPIKMYLEDIFTVQSNLSGHPAISLPMGTHSNGLPFGIQLVGKKFDEENMFDFSNELLHMK